MRGWRRVVVGVVMAGALAACGVPGSDFDRFDDSGIPFGLAETTTTVPSATGAAAPSSTGSPVQVTVRLYFVQDSALVGVERQLPSPSVGSVVAALVAGPLPTEGADLRSALPEDVVRGADVRAGVATVAVSKSFKDLASSEQRLAVAELVVTLTGRPGVGQVAFTIDDERVPVPTGSGELADRPVSRDDFAALIR